MHCNPSPPSSTSPPKPTYNVQVQCHPLHGPLEIIDSLPRTRAMTLSRKLLPQYISLIGGLLEDNAGYCCTKGDHLSRNDAPAQRQGPISANRYLMQLAYFIQPGMPMCITSESVVGEWRGSPTLVYALRGSDPRPTISDQHSSTSIDSLIPPGPTSAFALVCLFLFRRAGYSKIDARACGTWE